MVTRFGIKLYFEILEDKSDLYLKVLKEYFDANAPFRLNGYRQVKYLLDHIGYEATYCFVNDSAFDKRDIWMSFIWECVPEKEINEKIVNDYKAFIVNNLANDKPIITTVQVMARYSEQDSEFKATVIKAILTNSKLSASF